MKWEAKQIVYKTENRIAVYFEKNQQLIDRIKKLDVAQWSQSKKFWHLPDTFENRERFKIVVSQQQVPSEEGVDYILKFLRWLTSKRYSPNTIKTYTEALRAFLIFFNERSVASLTNEDVVTYNNEYILKKGLSASYQNQIVNAIKLFLRLF